MVDYEKKGHIALVTLTGTGPLPWGTMKEEHRINLDSIEALHKSLDKAEHDPEVHCLVVWGGPGRYFSNGLDLKWIDTHPDKANGLQEKAEELLRRLLVFPLPTVAAINGHFCAAGAMLGLAFDYRIMNAKRGYFFVPAIDLGLVYSPGMTALLKSKTPQAMHMDMICYAKRYTAEQLLKLGVVSHAVEPGEVLSTSLQLAQSLSKRGGSPLYRQAMSGIKTNLYSEAVAALWSPEKGTMTADSSMGFQNKPIGVDRPPVNSQGRAKL